MLRSINQLKNIHNTLIKCLTHGGSMYYWLCMVIAIFSEVFGTLFMKYSVDHASLLGISIMYLMLILSYSSLAIAVKRIPLALAYGFWESIGLILIVLFSAILFAESLSMLKITAIFLIVIGILLLQRGIESQHN